MISSTRSGARWLNLTTNHLSLGTVPSSPIYPPCCTCRRRQSTQTGSSSATTSSSTLQDQSESSPNASRSKSDWKRRQEGSNFIDTLSVALFSGKGGSGGVAFHREKFMARGPPSGGPGGTGGSVYLVATPTVTSLSHLPSTLRAGRGGSGGGKWLAGKQGQDVYLRVPIGTVVKEVRPRKDEQGQLEDDRQELEYAWEVNKVRLEEADRREVRWNRWKKGKEQAEKLGEGSGYPAFDEELEFEFEPEKKAAHERVRKDLFVFYPMADLESHPTFLLIEHQILSRMLDRQATIPGRKTRRPKKRDSMIEEEAPLLSLDLIEPTPFDKPILLLQGGQAGIGNSSFQQYQDRSPKYATKGGDGEMMRVDLEVKAGGEVGFVGMPNAGKSTLLRALTSSTPRVASYAFTTLNPHHGTCVIYSDQSFSGPRGQTSISDTSSLPEQFSADSSRLEPKERRLQRRSLLGPSTPADVSTEEAKEVGSVDKVEILRFTLTDNPGLVERSAENVGLGHAFLRHLERCRALIYVVDLSSTTTEPVQALKALRNELKMYDQIKGTHLLDKIRGIVVNKADLFSTETINRDGEQGAEVVEMKQDAEEGKRKLDQVMQWVQEVEKEDLASGMKGRAEPKVWVSPVSAKRRENLKSLVKRLETTVRYEREKQKKAEEQESSDKGQLETEEHETR